MVIGVVLYLPKPERLHTVYRRDLKTRLEGSLGTLLLSSIITIVAIFSFDEQLSLDIDYMNIFALNRDLMFDSFYLFQPITSIFIHADIVHFISNLTWIGILVIYERRVGWRRYFEVFFIASISTFIIDIFRLDFGQFSMGASAGITGLIAAYFLDEQDIGFKELFLTLPLLLLYLFISDYTSEVDGFQIHWVAHLLGASIGGLYVFLKPRDYSSENV